VFLERAFDKGSCNIFLKLFARNRLLVYRWIWEGGVDFASLCVLSKDMPADKNVLYCGTEIIAFGKLGRLKFIAGEL